MINQNGFFAQAGPLEIFVSAQLMPPDLKFDPGREGSTNKERSGGKATRITSHVPSSRAVLCYAVLLASIHMLLRMWLCAGLPVNYSAEENIRIEQDSEVRIKIIGEYGWRQIRL